MPAAFIARSPRSKVRVGNSRCDSSSRVAAASRVRMTRQRRARPKNATAKKASPPYAQRWPILSNGERNRTVGKRPDVASTEAVMTSAS
jgi:hypothetical protein